VERGLLPLRKTHPLLSAYGVAFQPFMPQAAALWALQLWGILPARWGIDAP